MIHSHIAFWAWVFAVGLAWHFPKRHHLTREADALKRGYSLTIIRLTRSTQYFTLFGQLLYAFGVPSVAVAVEFFVFLLYHGMIHGIGVETLSYEDVFQARESTGFYPPKSLLILPWIGLHLQHTICPIMAWMDFPFLWADAGLVVCAIATYTVWMLYCWRVQGVPPYPFLSVLLDKVAYKQRRRVDDDNNS